jgi:hypothetical protein
VPTAALILEYPLPVAMPGFAACKSSGRRRQVRLRITYTLSTRAVCGFSPREFWILAADRTRLQATARIRRFDRTLIRAEIEWLYRHDPYTRHAIDRAVQAAAASRLKRTRKEHLI